MRWYDQLYVGENAAIRKKKIISSIKHHKAQLGAYVITLPANDQNSLEVYPAYVLLQKYYRKQDLFVVGIGLGREETFLVVQEILMDCYHRTGQFLVRKMLETDCKNKLPKTE